MKKVIVSGIFMLFSIGMYSQTTVNNLPQTAQDFIKQHFSSFTAEEVTENSDWKIWKDEKYEVRFSNGIELDFDKNGTLIEIDSDNTGSIPESALPSNILSYLKSNHPGAKIVGWEKQEEGQEVELADGTEVEFDQNGEFLRID